MDCVTYKNVIRTSPGGAYAHKRTYDGEIEAPTLVPSHRHVKNGVTTGKITRCVGNPKKVLQNGKDRRRQKSNANIRVKKRGKSMKIQRRKRQKGEDEDKKIRRNWEIDQNGKGGRKKRSYWTRAMAWLQQLAPD